MHAAETFETPVVFDNSFHEERVTFFQNEDLPEDIRIELNSNKDPHVPRNCKVGYKEWKSRQLYNKTYSKGEEKMKSSLGKVLSKQDASIVQIPGNARKLKKRTPSDQFTHHFGNDYFKNHPNVTEKTDVTEKSVIDTFEEHIESDESDSYDERNERSTQSHDVNRVNFEPSVKEKSPYNYNRFNVTAPPHYELDVHHRMNKASHCKRFHSNPNHFYSSKANSPPPHFCCGSNTHCDSVNCYCSTPLYEKLPCQYPEYKSKSDNKQILKQQKKIDKLDNALKNLYKIVYLQNEQLALIQKQLNEIKLQTESENNKNDDTISEIRKKRSTGEVVERNLSPIDECNEKVSVGVMTSFLYTEKQIKKINTKQQLKQKVVKQSSSESDEESDNQHKPDVSLTLHGVDVKTIDRAVSPEIPVRIDMTEYNNSSTSTDSDDEESSSSSDNNKVGWTFYDNIVGQVNNMLQQNSKKVNNVKSEMADVRNATLEQLKYLGISYIDSAESVNPKRVTFDYPQILEDQRNRKDSDTSLQINALAMKYLHGNFENDGGITSNLPLPTTANNNLSLATLRYLDRYKLKGPADLMKNSDNQPEIVHKKNKKHKKKVDSKRSKKEKLLDNNSPMTPVKSLIKNPTSKILDITAIKQQPKLLPKKY